jgi:hypothetical protein
MTGYWRPNISNIIITILMALQRYCWALAIFNFSILYTVRRTPCTGISTSQGVYLQTGKQKQNERRDIYSSNGIRTHDSSIRAARLV